MGKILQPNRFSVGLGYRRALHDAMLGLDDGVLDFVELAPENFVGLGGGWKRRLDAVRARWPVLTHGLSLSVGGSDRLDSNHIDAMAGFVAELDSPHHSDHLCLASGGGQHSHELLPMVYSKDSARRVAQRIRDIQSSMDTPFVVENVSAYGRRVDDTMDEPDFVSEVCELADCGILLDVNNILVNALNFGADPFELLSRFPAERALQIHVAGFRKGPDGLVIDSHGEAVDARVWPLLEAALRRTGPIPVLLERDGNFPEIDVLCVELTAIRDIGARVFGGA